MTPRKPCPPVPKPLEEYAQHFDDVFGQLAQRRSFREYLLGLLRPRDRHQPLTALAGTEPVVGARAAAVQRLQSFVTESPWEVTALHQRRLALRQADPHTTTHAGGVLILDDTGDRKSGTHTAHVGRQYLGSVGKIDNGSVVVSTLWADEQRYYPLHAEPYTPARRLPKGKADGSNGMDRSLSHNGFVMGQNGYPITEAEGGSTMHCITLGIELAKQIFQLPGVDERGHVAIQKRVTRSKLLATVAQLPPCVIGMEACGSAPYWAREFQRLGHAVKVISPQFVRPYVKGNKNDSRDAEASCEAVTRPHMRCVPLKTVESHESQAIHRMRRRLIKERTALVNQIRGLLAERGIVIAQGITRLRQQLPAIVEDIENALTPWSREGMRGLPEELIALDERITRADRMVQRVFTRNAACQKLAQVEGIGPVVATALVAAVGNAQEFAHGRHLAAWLGVVPRQSSSGGKERVLGSSKRGDRYLRTVLIHGARATVLRARHKTDARSRWIRSLEQRRGKNIATVAIANKNARIAWARLTTEAEYRKAA